VKTIRYKLLISFLSLLWCLSGETSLTTIKGTVIDSVTYEGIADVNIAVQGMKVGTVSHLNGFFVLTVAAPQDSILLTFSHIGYQTKSVPASYFERHRRLKLTEKSIPLPGVEIAGEKKAFEYDQQLTNPVSRLAAEAFELKGFTDAADLLHNDPSVYIQETLSGKKTISVRGAAAEDVTVLYNGVKINNNFNNLYDLSIIDPASLEQIDLIKGGSAASFGALNDMAVINLIPKEKQDYILKFNQRFGSYDLGEWGLNFYENIGGVDVFSSYGQGSTHRIYHTVADDEASLLQTNDNLLAHINYQSQSEHRSAPMHTINLDHMQSNRNFEHQNYAENFGTQHQFNAVHYKLQPNDSYQGQLIFSQQNYTEKHQYNFKHFDYKRVVQDDYLGLETKQKLQSDHISLLLDYLYNQSDLDYTNQSGYTTHPDYLADSQYRRLRNGYGANLRLHTGLDTTTLQLQSVNLSIHFENVLDRPLHAQAQLDQKTWRQTSYIAAFVMGATTPDKNLNLVFNFARTYNIPTLYQQLSAQFYRYQAGPTDRLHMELKHQLDFNFEVNNLPSQARINYRFDGAAFYNYFDGKFRNIHISGSPLQYFDNFTETTLSGVESNLYVYFIRPDLAVHFSFAKYWFADRFAFSFKPDQNIHIALNYTTPYVGIELVGFMESERYGSVYSAGEIMDISLSKFSNVDLHLTTSLPVWRTRLSLALSGRNILSDQKTLEGIAIRDRRIYLTGAIEFK